jgi:hypothetical protein
MDHPFDESAIDCLEAERFARALIRADWCSDDADSTCAWARSFHVRNLTPALFSGKRAGFNWSEIRCD